MQVLWETCTDILISYHYLNVESWSSCAPPLAPDSCFSHPFLSSSYLNCCSPCPLHRASSYTSCSCSFSSSNPPSQATFAKSVIILLIELYIYYIPIYIRVTVKPCLASDEGPLDLITIIFVSLLLLFLCFISLLALLESVLIQNPLCKSPCE